jgi:hypothetical protein
VPLADFEGLSCAAALKDLAVLCLCQFGVSPEKVGYFRNRVFLRPDEAPVQVIIDRPLSIAESPVWEGYRTRVEVAYTDTAGEDGTAVGGESGESARTMEVDSQLIQSRGHAEWLADRLAGFFGVIRASKEIEGIPVAAVHLADQVTVNGQVHFVIQSSLGLSRRRQGLTVVET